MTSLVDLSSPEAIRRAYNDEFLPLQQNQEWQEWLAAYVQMIEKVRSASVDEMASPEFQRELWESTSISSTGMGSISMTAVIENQEVSQWIASLRDRELPPPGRQRTEALQNLLRELHDRVRPLTTRRPKLKAMRLLAAIYPRDISCVVDHGKLRRLIKAMFPDVKRIADLAVMNAMVLQKIDEVLGPPEDSPGSWAKRSMFAWRLYQIVAREDVEESGEVEGQKPGESELNFLPYERRTKGLMSISGYVNTLLKILDFVQNGATEAETVEYHQQENSKLKKASAKQQLRFIRHILGVLQMEGATLTPSVLGQQLLETSDPTILLPRLLTRVIGLDFVLYFLKENEPVSREDMYAATREHMQWGDFGASSLLGWAQKLHAVYVDDQKNYRLTGAGREWAEKIKTKPEPLINSGGEDPPVEKIFQPPSLEEILAYFEASPYVFPRKTIARLHVALHSHPFKHFVLLSGLSGTGKTKLAELYANAYHRIAPGEENQFFCLTPVQPDWTDPAGLLGYVNPLQETPTYAATAFLTFLRSAAERTQTPHFVCLDEMNLARVEYYFAPFLSAMETERDIIIHQNDEPVDTIEASLPWPRNLYIIGTVNMDETTHAFSDKVLDRAFTLEFWEVDLKTFGERFARERPDYPPDLLRFAMEALDGLQRILEPAHQHFGYRAAEETLSFLGANKRLGADVMTPEETLDQALLMKVLPKLRGQDSPEFRECLEKLLAFLQTSGLAESAKKIAAMKAELERTGVTRFWR